MSLTLPAIPPLDAGVSQQAAARQAELLKPVGALGHLEALSVRLAAMTSQLTWTPKRKVILLFAGDHGVVAQGVSAYPQAVTAQMLINFARGQAAVNVLARQLGLHLSVVDAGVATDYEIPSSLGGLITFGPVARGTADFTQGPAMTPAQAEAALSLGLNAAQREISLGMDLMLLGEMGIGNTASASAIIAAVSGLPVEQVTGPGSGLGPQGVQRKIDCIQRALALHHPADVDTLTKVGGFEIGAMAGAIIGAAAARVPVILDGLISTAAALIACQYAPASADYLIAGHLSPEPGHRVALDRLGLEPVLNLGLRLGEGSGAALAAPIVEAAARTLTEMSTFAEAGISRGP